MDKRGRRIRGLEVGPGGRWGVEIICEQLRLWGEANILAVGDDGFNPTIPSLHIA
jgi:hypothetical protein